MNYLQFSTEVKSGLVAKYDQRDLFAPASEFCFNQYHKQNPATVRNIIRIYFEDLKKCADLQDYLISECMQEIVTTANNQQESYESS